MPQANRHRPMNLVQAMTLAATLALPTLAWAAPSRTKAPSPAEVAARLERWAQDPYRVVPDAQMAVLSKALEDGQKLTLSPDAQRRLDRWRAFDQAERAIANLPWQAGPAEVPLGATAHLSLPGGFKLLTGDGLTAYATAQGQPPPGTTALETTLGVVMTQDRTVTGRLVLLTQGHTDDRQALKPDEILEALNDHRGRTAQALDRLQHPGAAALPADIMWLLPPVVDPQRHTLTWARNGDPSLGERDLFSFVLLGKDSCLLLEVLDPPDREAMAKYQARLQPLLAAMAFLPGHAYGDHQGASGPLTLAALVRGPETAAERASAALEKLPPGSEGKSFWGFLVEQAGRIVTALAFISLAYASLRRYRKSRPDKPV